MYKIYILIVFIITLLIVYFLPSVEFSKQKLLLDSLKQISSIVLAITGAWAAIVYPESLKKIIYKQESYREDMQSIKNLIRPMQTSIIILAMIIFIEISAFSLKLTYIPYEYIAYLRKFSFFVILNLYIFQIWTLILVMIPINDSYRKADIKRKKNDYLKEKHKNSKML
jgi:hypothetical protein